MKKLASTVLILIAIAGCQSLPANLTPGQALYAAHRTFNVGLEALDAYVQQPRCSETVIVGCYDLQIASKAFEAQNVAARRLEDADALVGQCAASCLSVEAARAAVQAFAGYLVAHSIVDEEKVR